jgi:hypothetical protein
VIVIIYIGTKGLEKRSLAELSIKFLETNNHRHDFVPILPVATAVLRVYFLDVLSKLRNKRGTSTYDCLFTFIDRDFFLSN